MLTSTMLKMDLSHFIKMKQSSLHLMNFLLTTCALESKCRQIFAGFVYLEFRGNLFALFSTLGPNCLQVVEEMLGKV